MSTGNGESQPRHHESAKSDASIAFYASYQPPIEVVAFDGTSKLVPFVDLDEELAGMRKTFKERRKSHGTG